MSFEDNSSAIELMTRRRGMVFVEAPDLAAAWDEPDTFLDGRSSHFQFYATDSPTNSDDSSVDEMTDAQKIVLQYRAQEVRDSVADIQSLVDLDDTSSSSVSYDHKTVCPAPSELQTICSETVVGADGSETVSPEDAISVDLSDFSDDENGIRYRESTLDELAEPLAEAVNEMHKSGAADYQPLVCPRLGCRDTLPNVFALSRHLHIHNMNDIYLCKDCEQSFARKADKWSHHCPAELIRVTSNSTANTPSPSVLEGLGGTLSRAFSVFNHSF